MECSCLEVNSHDVRSVELEVLVRIGWLDRVSTGCIATHAVTRHLDIEDMLLAISEGIRQNPFCPFATAGQAMNWVTMFRPDQPLIVRIPMELEVVLVSKLFRHGQLDTEPVR